MNKKTFLNFIFMSLPVFSLYGMKEESTELDKETQDFSKIAKKEIPFLVDMPSNWISDWAGGIFSNKIQSKDKFTELTVKKQSNEIITLPIYPLFDLAVSYILFQGSKKDIKWEKNDIQVDWLNNVVYNFLNFGKGTNEETFLKYFDLSYFSFRDMEDQWYAKIKNSKYTFLLQAIVHNYIYDRYDKTDLDKSSMKNRVSTFCAIGSEFKIPIVKYIQDKISNFDIQEIIAEKEEGYEKFKKVLEECKPLYENLFQERGSIATYFLLHQLNFNSTNFFMYFFRNIVKKLEKPLPLFEYFLRKNGHKQVKSLVMMIPRAKMRDKNTNKMDEVSDLAWFLGHVNQEENVDVQLLQAIASGVGKQLDDPSWNKEEIKDLFIVLLRKIRKIDNEIWVNLFNKFHSKYMIGLFEGSLEGLVEQKLEVSEILKEEQKNNLSYFASTISFFKKHPMITGLGTVGVLAVIIAVLKKKKLIRFPDFRFGK